MEPYHQLSDPSLHGLVQGVDGLEFQWTHSDMMPQDLVSILVTNPESLQDGSKVDEFEPPILSHEDEHFYDTEDN